jgi:hypothetical protein
MLSSRRRWHPLLARSQTADGVRVSASCFRLAVRGSRNPTAAEGNSILCRVRRYVGAAVVVVAVAQSGSPGRPPGRALHSPIERKRVSRGPGIGRPTCRKFRTDVDDEAHFAYRDRVIDRLFAFGENKGCLEKNRPPTAQHTAVPVVRCSSVCTWCPTVEHY